MKLGEENEARAPGTVHLRLALLAAFAVIVGLVVLPLGAERGSTGWWSSICGALGLTPDRGVPAPPERAPSALGSLVSWDRATDRLLAAGDPGRGERLAQDRCDACHAAPARRLAPDTPYLDGLSRGAVFKELMDYASGRRVAAAMQAVAARLSRQDMADAAAHYASLPRQPGLPRPSADTDAGRRDPIVKLVFQGDPSRDLAPCAACHGPDGMVLGAPPLVGQSAAYLTAQLRAFRAGSRHNDNLAQMRTPARGLEDWEISGLAAYLSPSAVLSTR